MIYEQKQCKYCNQIFKNIEGRVFSNHIRWCDKNPKPKVTQKGLENWKKAVDNKHGKIIKVNKKCAWCDKLFIIERRNKIKLREKKCCSKSCASKYSHSFCTNESKIKQSKGMKKVWKDEEYFQNQVINNSNKNKIFSSKGERELQKYFKENFHDDEWTFGGGLIYNNIRLTRDLYSNKLKVCIEYDGIWHFKDIHNQLEDKQEKDKQLKLWCKENKYRLIRIRDEVYNSNKDKYLQLLVDCVYNKSKKYVEFY